MSMHEEVTAAIHREIESRAGAIAMSPTSIAIAVQDSFSAGPIDPHLQYASLEHFKHMARAALAKRFEIEGDENDVMQGELFSGQLQEHYPTPRAKGQEPLYKRRDALTDDEVLWNIRSIRRRSASLAEHGDALQAWRDARQRRAELVGTAGAPAATAQET